MSFIFDSGASQGMSRLSDTAAPIKISPKIRIETANEIVTTNKYVEEPFKQLGKALLHTVLPSTVNAMSAGQVNAELSWGSYWLPGKDGQPGEFRLFKGGRLLHIGGQEIELKIDALCPLYDEATNLTVELGPSQVAGKSITGELIAIDFDPDEFHSTFHGAVKVHGEQLPIEKFSLDFNVPADHMLLHLDMNRPWKDGGHYREQNVCKCTICTTFKQRRERTNSSKDGQHSMPTVTEYGHLTCDWIDRHVATGGQTAASIWTVGTCQHIGGSRLWWHTVAP